MGVIMIQEEALKRVTGVLAPKTLNKMQIEMFRRVLNEQSYRKIARKLDREYSYIKDVGAEGRLLTQLLGINPGIGFKLLKNQSSLSEKGTTQYYSQKLKHLLELQIEQLATQPQIQWTRMVYQDPQMPERQQVIEASQMPFSIAKETLAYLQTEGWLANVLSTLAVKPINLETIEKGFYYCYFGESSQPNQYLLLFVKKPLSHTYQQFIKRTAASISEYLDEHQQNWQHRQKIQILEDIVQRVGHQLRHPLSLINLYARNLSCLLPKSKEQEQASVICKTVQGLDRTLIKIVHCARSEKLQMVLQDLRSLVYKTLEEFQGWISEKDLLVCCAERSLTFKLDSLQIKQAIGNLLNNTIHFSFKKQQFSLIGKSSRTMYC
jgi:K+-sensing histidine kinase KdpD